MLTKKQKQILDYVKKYIYKKGYSPTLKEIGAHLKLSSVATIYQHINILVVNGYLKKRRNQPRSIELINKENDYNLISIPLLGIIAAGQPIEAIEDKDTIKVSKSQLTPNGEHFALRVAGESMINDGIFDGDIVIVRKQETAENGEMIVALLDNDQVTLKRIFKEKNGFRLQPANPHFKPIFVKELIVQGKITSIIRNLTNKDQKESDELTTATLKYIETVKSEYRKSLGQYFTPRSIREELISNLPKIVHNPKILDPSCGTGEFLITAKKYFKDADLHGWDIDKKLIDIAKKLVPQATLLNTNSLIDKSYNSFDLVIGNPPYFEFKPEAQIRNTYSHVISGRPNIFAFFIRQGILWLKNGGYLAYVVPPSMNNGAYFSKLREFIVANCNIEYLKVLNNPRIFKGALQSTMLLILKKGRNKGDYLFKKNGVLLFSENVNSLDKSFKGMVTLGEIGYKVRTGKIAWNQNKTILTNDPTGAVPLIWAHNITENGLTLPMENNKKPQYIKNQNNYDLGPAIVVNRVTGSVSSTKLKAALIPSGMKFFGENHVNVIFPPSKPRRQLSLLGSNDNHLDLKNIIKQLTSPEKMETLKNITGNTQISKTELENLFPLNSQLVTKS